MGNLFCSSLLSKMSTLPTPRTDAFDRDFPMAKIEETPHLAWREAVELARQLERDLAARDAELAAEKNLHGQTRVVVEELNIICNDLRNAGQPQFIRSEAIRLLREDQAELRSKLQTATERAERAEREVERLQQDCDRSANIAKVMTDAAATWKADLAALRAVADGLAEDAKQMRVMLYVANTGMRGYHDDGELQDNREQPFIDFKRDSIAEIQAKFTQRNLNAARAASADGHASKEEAP